MKRKRKRKKKEKLEVVDGYMSYRTDLFHRGPVPDRVESLRPRSVTNDIVFCKIVRIGEISMPRKLSSWAINCSCYNKRNFCQVNFCLKRKIKSHYKRWCYENKLNASLFFVYPGESAVCSIIYYPAAVAKKKRNKGTPLDRTTKLPFWYFSVNCIVFVGVGGFFFLRG